MQDVLGNDWIIKSAGGSSGEAYLAQSKQKRLFLKRNSSPFLAVLSAQGIVPKLIWTKRLENGDVITAQEWLDGRVMEPDVIHHPNVAELLGRIHHSTELLDMLTRMGKKPLDPTNLYEELAQFILKKQYLADLGLVEEALNWMSAQLKMVCHIKPVVCHCDLNHNNWFVTNGGKLFLIDWDNAEIGDPALDLATLFKRYIDDDEQENWLDNYGVKSNFSLDLRIHWYMIYQSLIELDEATNFRVLDVKLSKLKDILTSAKRLA